MMVCVRMLMAAGAGAILDRFLHHAVTIPIPPGLFQPCILDRRHLQHFGLLDGFQQAVLFEHGRQ